MWPRPDYCTHQADSLTQAAGGREGRETTARSSPRLGPLLRTWPPPFHTLHRCPNTKTGWLNTGTLPSRSRELCRATQWGGQDHVDPPSLVRGPESAGPFPCAPECPQIPQQPRRPLSPTLGLALRSAGKPLLLRSFSATMQPSSPSAPLSTMFQVGILGTLQLNLLRPWEIVMVTFYPKYGLSESSSPISSLLPWLLCSTTLSCTWSCTELLTSGIFLRIPISQDFLSNYSTSTALLCQP